MKGRQNAQLHKRADRARTDEGFGMYCLSVETTAASLVISFLLAGGSLMARGLAYTPEEDAIILSTPMTAEIQQQLREQGFPERTDNAVKQRRNDLRNGPKKGLRRRPVQTGTASGPLVTAAAELERTNERISELEAQLFDARARAEQMRKALATQLAKEGR